MQWYVGPLRSFLKRNYLTLMVVLEPGFYTVWNGMDDMPNSVSCMVSLCLQVDIQAKIYEVGNSRRKITFSQTGNSLRAWISLIYVWVSETVLLPWRIHPRHSEHSEVCNMAVKCPSTFYGGWATYGLQLRLTRASRGLARPGNVLPEWW